MLVWVGSIVGVVLGFAHAVYVYRVVANDMSGDASPAQTRGMYYAVWTVLLWVLFGTYVVVLWLVGIVMYPLFKAFR